MFNKYLVFVILMMTSTGFTQMLTLGEMEELLKKAKDTKDAVSFLEKRGFQKLTTTIHGDLTNNMLTKTVGGKEYTAGFQVDKKRSFYSSWTGTTEKSEFLEIASKAKKWGMTRTQVFKKSGNNWTEYENKKYILRTVEIKGKTDEIFKLYLQENEWYSKSRED